MKKIIGVNKLKRIYGAHTNSPATLRTNGSWCRWLFTPTMDSSAPLEITPREKKKDEATRKYRAIEVRNEQSASIRITKI